MEPEKLKICAKTVGCKYIHHYSFEHDGFYVSRDNKVFLYDPEHNDAQMAELLKWLIDRGIQIDRGENCYWICGYNDNKHLFQVEGQTLNQAVINAVVEVNHG